MPYFDQTGQNRTQRFGVEDSDKGIAVAIEPGEITEEKSAPDRGRPEGARSMTEDGVMPLDAFYVALQDPEQDAIGISRGTAEPEPLPTEEEVAELEEAAAEEEAAAAEEEGEVPAEDEEDLSDHTVEELREMASEEDINLHGATTKDDIIAAIEEATSAPAEEEAPASGEEVPAEPPPEVDEGPNPPGEQAVVNDPQVDITVPDLESPAEPELPVGYPPVPEEETPAEEGPVAEGPAEGEETPPEAVEAEEGTPADPDAPAAEETAPEEAPVEEEALADKTIVELRELAGDEGINLHGATRKDDIVAVIEEARAPDVDG